MAYSIILLISLWLYPVIAFLTIKKKQFSKSIIWYTLVFSLFIILSHSLRISTISDGLDIVIVSFLWFAMWLFLWAGCHFGKKIISVPSIGLTVVLIIASFFGGFLSFGTFVLGDFDLRRKEALNYGLIYKERSIGHATVVPRTKSVEVYKKIRWFPLLEKRLVTKSYTEPEDVFKYLILDEDYEDRLILKSFEQDSLTWSDTLYFDQRP